MTTSSIFRAMPYRAVSLRTYDATKKQWLIWWIDARNPSHLDPPVVGGFKNGIGTFYANDTFKGKPIRIRFLWTNLTAEPHWEQAFSDDGGKTWETNWIMEFVKSPTRIRTSCPVVELRQYTLVPGARETLIELFEREFIETQEATGMTVIGQFRDLNNQDRFVWLRGFSDMDARATQLQAFYSGPVWKAHRDAANATMIDSDNVLLLRPASPTSGFQLEHASRAPVGSTVRQDLLVATIYHLDKAKAVDFSTFFERELQPHLTNAGISVLASFVTETHPNTFPRLPVREDANVFVWFSRFPDREAYEKSAAAVTEAMRERQVATKLAEFTREPPEVLLLSPAARSRL